MFAHKALTEATAKRSPAAAARAAATEMAFGALRRKLTLDNAIASASNRSIASVDPVTLCVLRLSASQLMFMRQEAPYAVVHEAVEQSKKLSGTAAAGFTNAVLRRMTSAGFSPAMPDAVKDPAFWLSVTESHPLWLTRLWTERFGLDVAKAMCEYDNAAPQASVRVNTRRTSRQELMARLQAEGMDSRIGELSPFALILSSWDKSASSRAFEEGLYSLQDQSSMLVAELLAPKPGEVVFDLCAAPGGKACHAAEMAEDEGSVEAFDINRSRLELVKENAGRLKLGSVRCVEADARNIGLMRPGEADAVIADVPCSGLGVLSRRPDARWRKDPTQFAGFAMLGGQILDSAALALKPGGRLLFSTCTVSSEENEAQLGSFLAKHPEFYPMPLARLEATGLSAPGSGCAQLLQGVHGSDGFFVSLLRKS